MKRFVRTSQFRRVFKKEYALPALIVVFFLMGGGLLWVATLKLPDVSNFQARIVSQSTKFYDRTGKIPLFNVYENIRRTEVPFEDISPLIKNATIAIEDDRFYQHNGVRPIAFLRAVFANVKSLSFSQGGSTITQQVVKNSLLNGDKSLFGGPIRKVKEWILAIKLEKVLSKEAILSVYLNENPYGGNIYGVEEAARAFFGISANDVDLAQAAYIAALPQAPSYFSPYGNHKKDLDSRKNFVLQKMKELDYINDDEYKRAVAEDVTFLPSGRTTVIAPHFVFYLRDYLAEKYGENSLDEGGLSVITTIDADLQKKAEEIVKKYALSNEKQFDASNAGLVAIDPKTGQILALVGSRDYFDKEIDGNFNIATAKRQPGSSFKPFVYASALKKGYTDKTVLFDTKTEFSANCSNDSTPNFEGAVCYSPENYDLKFRGPVTLREALGQSMNIPAVKILYLAGMRDTLQTAKSMGISTLTDPDRYGLTLVLGGGEIELLELTSAYSAFANDGVRNPSTGILEITDSEGNTLEKFEDKSSSVLDSNVARTITSILSDDVARTPLYGPHSLLYFDGREVAAKTGTTNDYRDAWVEGYTPSLAVGSWAGNNDNSPMQKKISGQIIVPLWHEFMNYALSKYPNETFPAPIPPENQDSLPAALKGIVQQEGGQYHDILYWVNKDNPQSGRPFNPGSDSQFAHWEYGVQNWIARGGAVSAGGSTVITDSPVPTTAVARLVNDFPTGVQGFSQAVHFTVAANYGDKVQIYVNGKLISTLSEPPFYISISPREYPGLFGTTNSVRIVNQKVSGSSTNEDYALALDLSR